jgi:hypothetical protein
MGWGRRYRPLIFLCLLLAWMGTAACQPSGAAPTPPVAGPSPTRSVPGTALPFVTLDRRESTGTGEGYSDRYPALVVITSGEEAGRLDTLVGPGGERALEVLDYTEYVAIAVFQGGKSTLGYGVEIKHITREDDNVWVQAYFTEPEPDDPLPDMVSSPYHLVRVRKSDGWLGPATAFRLVVDGNVVATASEVAR